MELTVARVDLQKELQLCQGVVEKRSTIPILSNVLLKAADTRLQIAATDLDVTILSSCAAKITSPGGVTIEAKRLFDIVRSLPDEDVHVTMQENNSMLIESGTAKFRLLGLPAEDYPTLPTVTATESYTVPLEELTEAAAVAHGAVAPGLGPGHGRLVHSVGLRRRKVIAQALARDAGGAEGRGAGLAPGHEHGALRRARAGQVRRGLAPEDERLHGAVATAATGP